MNKRGQMRIIEAMTACLLMVSGLAASMYFSSVYTATRNVNVEKKCVDIINLISKHEVTEEIILHKKSWRTNLKSLIESLLPPNVFYRITIRSSLNNTVVGVVTNIKNGSPLNEEPVSIKTSVTISVPLRIRKRVPIDIFFVMDVSASMLRTLPGDKVTKLESAKLAAKSFLDYLNSSRDRVGVISFCSVVTLECNLTSYFGSVREGIDGLRAWGLTNIGDGIYRATSEFNVNGRGDALLVIIVLSDGKANLPVN
ncbi:MAG TPA: VWA domain-containing protein, partial [Candidatus Bathyarchaeota archaeon]|nr:VWA domain-containing protein [Candidatus Bathyarchaeota archaeon]